MASPSAATVDRLMRERALSRSQGLSRAGRADAMGPEHLGEEMAALLAAAEPPDAMPETFWEKRRRVMQREGAPHMRIGEDWAAAGWPEAALAVPAIGSAAAEMAVDPLLSAALMALTGGPGALRALRTPARLPHGGDLDLLRLARSRPPAAGPAGPAPWMQSASRYSGEEASRRALLEHRAMMRELNLQAPRRTGVPRGTSAGRRATDVKYPE